MQTNTQRVETGDGLHGKFVFIQCLTRQWVNLSLRVSDTQTACSIVP